MQPPAPLPAPAGRVLRVGLALALVALAACCLYRALRTGHDQLVAPFSLGPAEFSNLETIQVIRAGRSPYDPQVYAAPPFVFTNYTPLYHYLVALLPMPDANPFFWGRIVAAGAMLAAGLLPFLVAGRFGWPIACVAAGVFLSLSPVVLRMVFLRNDALGLFLSALSVWVVHRSRGRSGWLVAAAALAILGVLAKQSLVAAPAACAVFLLASDRKAFLRYAVAGLSLAGACIAGIQLLWGDGFWFSTILGNGHPVLLGQALFITRAMLREPLFVALVAMGAVVLGLELRDRGRSALIRSPYPLYAFASGAVLALTLGKVGSGTNYFVEPILALLLWITHALRDAPRSRPRRALPSVLAAVVVAAGVLQLLTVPRPSYPRSQPAQAALQQRALESLRRDIESFGIERPRVMRLAGHPGLYRESDRVQLAFPDFYYWLWHSGLLDITAMTDRIDAQAFDVIIVPRRWVESKRPVTTRLWGHPALRLDGAGRLLDAALERYRVAGGRGARLYLLPADRGPPGGRPTPEREEPSGPDRMPGRRP